MTKGFAIAAIAVMAVVTFLTRALPFLLFGRDNRAPRVVLYLGKYLPPAVIAMLIVYCLRDVSFAMVSGWLPSLIAGLAGLPEGVIRRAKKILKEIESQGHVQEKPVRAPDPLDQITLGGMAGSDIIEELKTIDPNVLTPFEAMGRLYELVKKAKEC